MALLPFRRGLGSATRHNVFATRSNENDKRAPITLVRPGIQESANSRMTGVPLETYTKYIQETDDDQATQTYNVDFLIPAGSIIHNVALWTAVTSALMDVGDYAFTDNEVGDAIDANGWWAALDLKALTITHTVNLAYPGLATTVGVYGNAVDAAASYDEANIQAVADRTVEALFSTSPRVLRFTVAKSSAAGAGTAGRTLVGVTFAHIAEVTDTISS